MRRDFYRPLFAVAVFLPMLGLLAGCEELDRAAGDAPAQPMGTTIAAPAILAPDESMPKQTSTANNQPATADQNTSAAGSEPMPPNEDVTVKKAEGSDGVKGSGYGGGIITEPVSQYFRLQNRIQFEIQIPKQLQLWKAEHNRFPKDEAEYEREILIPCGIDGMKGLPELPMNCRYIYDPKSGELLVETRTPG